MVGMLVAMVRLCDAAPMGFTGDAEPREGAPIDTALAPGDRRGRARIPNVGTIRRFYFDRETMLVRIFEDCLLILKHTPRCSAHVVGVSCTEHRPAVAFDSPIIGVVLEGEGGQPAAVTVGWVFAEELQRLKSL